MDVLAFAGLIYQRRQLVLLLGLLGLVVGLTVSLITPKRYQSTISLQLNPSARSTFLPYNNADGAAPNPINTLAASYIEVLRSRAFGEVVVQKLQLPVAADAISRSIEARLVPNTNILRLSVTWDHPEDARQLAQSVAEIFISQNAQRQHGGGQGQIDDLESQAQQIQNRLTGLRQQRDRLDQAVSRGDLSRLSDLNDLDQRLSGLETSYTNLLVEISRAKANLDTAAILDRAGPATPVGALPLPQAGVFGVLAGLGLAVALAFGLEYLKDAVNGPEEVVAVTGRPPIVVLGPSPVSGRDGDGIAMRDAPQSLVAESVRTLRTTIRLLARERPMRVLMVTSGEPNTGKTFLAINLAAAYAQAGKRTLLVDLDLRRPGIHRAFGLSEGPGLAEVLRDSMVQRNGHAGVEELPIRNGTAAPDLSVLGSGIEDLALLPAGHIPLQPSELLEQKGIVSLIKKLAAAWDVVILDTAPIGPVPDTLQAVEAADGVLVVARAGLTRRNVLRGALEALGEADAPVLGVVLNDLKPSPLGRYGQYRYYYGGYYGGAYTDGSPSARRRGLARRRRGRRQGLFGRVRDTFAGSGEGETQREPLTGREPFPEPGMPGSKQSGVGSGR